MSDSMSPVGQVRDPSESPSREPKSPSALRGSALLLALLPLLSSLACGEGGDGPLAPEEALELYGGFEATTSGPFDGPFGRMGQEHEWAQVILDDPFDPWNTSLVSISLGAPNADEDVWVNLLFEQYGSEPFGEGAVAVGDFCTEFQTGAPADGLYVSAYFDDQEIRPLGSFCSRSGTLTITSIRSDRVTATFSLELEGELWDPETEEVVEEGIALEVTGELDGLIEDFTVDEIPD